MYKLELINHHNQIQLKLSRSKTIIRTWYGSFAQIIFDKVMTPYTVSEKDSLFLSKNQVQLLFSEITCLYQRLICHHNINSDLNKNKISKEVFNVAESLLLQIRINSMHLSYEELQDYYLNEYSYFDLYLFNHTINLLIGKNLIQSIITEDGQQFFDKNLKPHNHIYFFQKKKLIDCSREIANIFSQSKLLKISKQNNMKIFYAKDELYNVFN